MMENFSAEKSRELLRLLERKLTGIPTDLLPILSLEDIVNQTTKAVNLHK